MEVTGINISRLHFGTAGTRGVKLKGYCIFHGVPNELSESICESILSLCENEIKEKIGEEIINGGKNAN